jgi:uroporphyrinogen-III synthase
VSESPNDTLNHQLPLNGKRIVITRAHTQAASLARELEALGATVISIPLIEIRPPQSFQPLDKALIKIQKYDWLILTSVNGVHALHKRLDKAGMAPSALRHLGVVAIGPATRDEIAKLGLTVKIMPEEYVAESVVAALQGQVKGKSVLLIRAKVARDVIPKALRDAGAEVDVAEAYETVLPVNAPKRLAENLVDGRLQADAITFTSSSTVRNLAAALSQGLSPKLVLEKVKVASIGPVTTATLLELGVKADVEASPFTIPGLVCALSDRLRPSY